MEEEYEYEPRLYSRIAIFIFALVLSTVFAGLMFYQNLKEIDNKKDRIPVLLFSFAWNIISVASAKHFTDSFLWVYILPNCIGGLLLAIPLWNSYLKEFNNNQTKPVWIPLAIAAVLYGGLIGLNLLLQCVTQYL